MPEVHLDKEFRALCPPLSDEEHHLLWISIAAEGCRDPLVVWPHKDKQVLIDGHNRLEICEELGKSYRLKAVKLASREAARTWIIDNALGRRNLSEEQKGYLRGKRYQAEKKEPHRPKGATAAPLKTVERMAAEYGVSERTIHNDAQYASAVDALAKNVGGDTKRDLLSGALKVAKQDVIRLAELPVTKQKAALASGASAVRAAVAPTAPKQQISDTFYQSLKGLAERIEGIREQYGTVAEMFESPVWDGCDTQFVVALVEELHRMFEQLDKEMRNHAKTKKTKLRQES